MLAANVKPVQLCSERQCASADATVWFEVSRSLPATSAAFTTVLGVGRRGVRERTGFGWHSCNPE